MEPDKNNRKKLLTLIIASLAVYWGLNHTPALLRIFEKFLIVISPFLIGLCFAFLINVLLRKIEGLWNKIPWKQAGISKRIRRPACLFLSLLLIISVIFIILFIVVPEIQQNILTIADMFPQSMEETAAWWDALAETALNYSIVLPDADLAFEEIGKMAGTFLSEKSDVFLNKTMDLTVSVVTVIVNLVLGLVFAIYVLLQKENLSRQSKKLLHAVLPSEKVKRITELAGLTDRVFTSFVAGQLMESVIIGVLCFLGMIVLRLPYSAVISVLVGFTALIPVFGALFGTVIGAFLILVVDPLQALIFVIFLVVLQQVEGNVIYPKVVGKSVGLPGIWVLVAVTVGGSMFGIPGMLLGVPTCSVLYSVLKQKVNDQLVKKNIRIS